MKNSQDLPFLRDSSFLASFAKLKLSVHENTTDQQFTNWNNENGREDQSIIIEEMEDEDENLPTENFEAFGQSYLS